MTGPIALATEGMGGIGEAIGIRLSDAGYKVVVTHSPINDGAMDWLASMAASGRHFSAYRVDVADDASCQACVARVQAEVGPVDILVNNAGITRDSSFKKLDKINWDAVLRTDLDSVFNMTKQVGGLERVVDTRQAPQPAGPTQASHTCGLSPIPGAPLGA